MGEEKKTREVTVFEDKYDIIYPYQRRLMFEDEDFNMRDYVSSDDEEMLEGMERVPYDRKAVLEYISQVRNSFKNKTSFELVEVDKAVITHAPFNLLFLTLAVKKVEEAKTETIRAIVYHPVCQPWELHQWMLVKPDATEA